VISYNGIFHRICFPFLFGYASMWLCSPNSRCMRHHSFCWIYKHCNQERLFLVKYFAFLRLFSLQTILINQADH
jgi:hypothetical protein